MLVRIEVRETYGVFLMDLRTGANDGDGVRADDIGI